VHLAIPVSAPTKTGESRGTGETQGVSRAKEDRLAFNASAWWLTFRPALTLIRMRTREKMALAKAKGRLRESSRNYLWPSGSYVCSCTTPASLHTPNWRRCSGYLGPPSIASSNDAAPPEGSRTIRDRQADAWGWVV
jgi:hypothetical protein